MRQPDALAAPVRHRTRWLLLLAAGAVWILPACGGSGGAGSVPTSSALPSRSAGGSASAPAAPTATATRPALSSPATSRTTAATATATRSLAAPPGAVTSVTVTATSAAGAASPSTATAGTAATGSDSDSTPWGWIIAAVVLVLALALGLPLLSRRRREQRWRGWQRQARTALDTGRLTERLLPVSAVEINDTEGWRTTGAQVEQAARGLDTVADSAPKPVGASAAHQAARDLRNLSLALESARVARAQTPSTVDLAAAETACQDRRLDLDAAFSQLEGVVAGTGP